MYLTTEEFTPTITNTCKLFKYPTVRRCSKPTYSGPYNMVPKPDNPVLSTERPAQNDTPKARFNPRPKKIERECRLMAMSPFSASAKMEHQKEEPPIILFYIFFPGAFQKKTLCDTYTDPPLRAPRSQRFPRPASFAASPRGAEHPQRPRGRALDLGAGIPQGHGEHLPRKIRAVTKDERG